MKIICFKNELINCIQSVQKAVPSRSTMDIITGVLLETLNDNILKLTATDLKLGIESQIPCRVIEEGGIVLPSNIFGELIRKFPEEEITITTSNNNTALVECKNSRFNISGMPAEDFPTLPSIEEEKFINISHNLFKTMIRQTNFAVSEDETRSILTGQLLEVREDKIRLVALDGFRISISDGKAKNLKGNEIDVIIPGKTLNELSKILSYKDSDEFSISLTENQILFDLGTTKVVSGIIDGEYLNYEKVIPDEFKTIVTCEKKSVIDSIDRAYLLAKEEKGNYLIKIKIEGNNIIVTSNSEIGNVYEKITVEKEGEDLEIAFNSRYIFDALKSTESEKVTMKFISSLSPCIITPFDSTKQLNMVLPVRLE